MKCKVWLLTESFFVYLYKDKLESGLEEVKGIFLLKPYNNFI